MTASEITTVVVTSIGLIANLVLTTLTAVYVILTKRMLGEMRAAREPSVFFDIEFPERDVRVVIGNSGESPALNVRFEVAGNIPWKHGPGPEGLNSIEAIRDGLPFLAPRRTLKFYAGYLDWAAAKNAHPRLTVTIFFENESGREFSRDYQINLSLYSEVLPESYRDSGFDVAKAIRDVEDSRRTQDTMQRITHQILSPRPKVKTCPICGSSIPEVAKKCPACHEFIESAGDTAVDG